MADSNHGRREEGRRGESKDEGLIRWTDQTSSHELLVRETDTHTVCVYVREKKVE